MSSTEVLQQRARKLIASANELLTIARDLEKMCGVPDGQGQAGSVEGNPACPEDYPLLLDLARRTYADRRRRSELFEPKLFGEPAWDLMLDLFIAAKEGKRLSVSSACIGAAVSATTALRWITVLESQGLVKREADTKDARRAYIYLSAEAYARMVDYFASELQFIEIAETELA